MRVKDKTYIWMSVWWKTKNYSWGIYMPRIHSVGRGTGTPKDRDEVNRRDVCEWDGWVCVLDVIGVPSMLRLTRKAAALARMPPTFALSNLPFLLKRRGKKKQIRTVDPQSVWVNAVEGEREGAQRGQLSTKRATEHCSLRHSTAEWLPRTTIQIQCAFLI